MSTEASLRERLRRLKQSNKALASALGSLRHAVATDKDRERKAMVLQRQFNDGAAQRPAKSNVKAAPAKIAETKNATKAGSVVYSGPILIHELKIV